MNDGGEPSDSVALKLRQVLDAQRAAFLREGSPPAAVRRDRLDRCIGILVDQQDELAAAADHDFGGRPAALSKFTDISGSIVALKYARDHLEAWMRPERRRTTPAILGWLGARAEVHTQPLGVVGLIAAWNFPVNLALAPLAGILAAGNRCMIKPSEYTPATAALLARLFAAAFDTTEIAVCPGGPEVGIAFSHLPFDHLLFTGATSVARHIMHAAAEHLVPVTLELGGKSPVVVGSTANLDLTATRVMAGKLMNAGQICLAPDYLLLPAGMEDAFVTRAVAAVGRMFPRLVDNPDHTSILDERHAARLEAIVADARAKGARVIEINPAGEDLGPRPRRRMPPTLILDPTADMLALQDEIFGPILPVKTYAGFADAIAWINARLRPLAVYYFGTDREEERQLLARTTSGGITVNDVVMQIGMEDLPFGGAGASGMGRYHGRDGFRQFSNHRSLFSQPTSRMVENVLVRMRPPYGDRMRTMLASMIRR